MTVAQHGLVGDMKAPVDVTYLADTVILLRYFEARGRVRRAIPSSRSAPARMKTTIREYRIACGLPSANRSMGFMACCAAFRPIPAKASPLLEEQAKVRPQGRLRARCSFSPRRAATPRWRAGC